MGFNSQCLLGVQLCFLSDCGILFNFFETHSERKYSSDIQTHLCLYLHVSLPTYIDVELI